MLPMAGAFPYSTSMAGTYQFRVTDNQGCVSESNIITVTPAIDPVATATAIDPTCNGDANGIAEINVDPNFGIAPYLVSFDGSPFTAQTVYTGLIAGTYNYTVQDSKGCLFSDTRYTNGSCRHNTFNHSQSNYLWRRRQCAGLNRCYRSCRRNR